MAKILILGASGKVGSALVKALDAKNTDNEIILSTSREATAEMWHAEGRKAIVIDLDKPEEYAENL